MLTIRQKHKAEVQDRLTRLPYYVDLYFQYLEHEKKCSPSTLRGYALDYEMFFSWMIVESLSTAENTSTIPLSDLDNLHRTNIQGYISHLKRHGKHKKSSEEQSESAISRKLSSLKSLFNWLYKEEDPEDRNQTLLNYNVMAKIEITSKKSTPAAVRARMKPKSIGTNDITDFIDFVNSGYRSVCTHKLQLSNHDQNRERDTAMIALTLGSGIRLSELVNLNLDQIDKKDRQLLINRKGNKEDAPFFSIEALYWLEKYLEVREVRYIPDKNETALFLSAGKTHGKRLHWRTFQEIVKKYGAAYGKPSLTVHGLRHSFASKYIEDPESTLPSLQTQLGHSSITTTQTYTHTSEDQQRSSVDRVTR
ncbi:tyrosine recombinase XerS [Brevibacillus sp. AY1]|uniref:tyrosine recombinase XerS n=1 Tax=Brevibacillus sp. AY1 TaxID=2807621 RepID=UPI002454C2E2|nr:tyrosine recombinase XerS [Brevibacillus sp. AY1]MDH4619846.1 tyrosine recombinase XerS [Brevibacillus sp. AY1]